ncbi:hypothetical protein Cs7R123_53180 [Catellatospora sp. TT07R-123]|uniref:hypothetical protein n=1 Tax=Catellatospora sp. TT07R-123 TaxID=2733863 RepID=UPI001B24BAC4|nr:hypothetical protein [Catellatospora sp. TT07R-123]GHJ47976.1 hypothetical protein Cs7R123_53180 [Catellatospora sp. TT07R-123]
MFVDVWSSLPTAETPDLSMSLAVQDFAPALLAFLGYLLLAPSALGRVGALLMGLGGLAKSTWKLLHAGWSIDVPWLDDLLFPLLAAGGVLLAIALHRRLRWSWWPLAAAGLVAAGLAVKQMSVQPAFIAATAFVIWISIVGAVWAWRNGEALAAALFPISVLAVLALVPLRNHPASDALAFQWVQQGVNTMAQLIFCVAGALTFRAVRRGGGDFPAAERGDVPSWGMPEERTARHRSRL